MYLYMETKKGSNLFMCRGQMDGKADDSHGFARKMAKQGIRVAQHPDEMGKNMADPIPGQPMPCYVPVPLDDVVDRIVTV